MLDSTDTNPDPERKTNWRRIFVVSLLISILGLWSYGAAFARMASTWTADPDYSHGFLVFPIAIAFLWLRRSRCPQIEFGFSWLGVTLLVTAGLVRYFAARLYLPELDVWSFLLWLPGILWLFCGWPMLRWALPAIAFLSFAMPLPNTVAVTLSVPLQKLAAQLSAVALQFVGLPAIVEGTTILLGDHTLEVEKACSGLRMFYGISAVAFATILLYRPGFWKSCGVVLAIAPVAIFVNVLRIFGTGLLTVYFGAGNLQRVAHDFAGVVVIPLAVLIFVGLLLFVERFLRNWQYDPARTVTKACGVIAVCLAGCVIAAWWFEIQQERAYQALLEAANRFEQEGDLPMAVSLLNRYNMARPDDVPQHSRLAELYAELAESPAEKSRAAELLRSAYRANPDRRQLALKTIDLAAETGSYSTALELFDEIQSADKQRLSAQAEQKHADVLISFLGTPEGARQGRYTWHDAASAIEKTLTRDVYSSRNVAALALIMRERLIDPDEQQRISQADQLINQLVQTKPKEAEAWLIRYRYGTAYWSENPKYDPDADLDRALEVRSSAPPEIQAEILVFAAEREGRRGSSLTTGLAYLEEALEVSPASEDPYLRLADLYSQADGEAGHIDVIDFLRRGLDATGGQSLEIAIKLCHLLAEDGREVEAQQLLQPLRSFIPRIDDDETRSYLRLAIASVESTILRRQGKMAQAALTLRTNLESPESTRAATDRLRIIVAQSWRHLAQIYALLGRPDQELVARQRVLQLSPSSTDARRALLEAAVRAGDLETALLVGRNWVQDDSKSADAWAAIASIQVLQQRQMPPDRRDFKEAQRSISQAWKNPPPSVPVVLASVDLLRAQNRNSQAISLLQKSLGNDPKQPKLWESLVVLHLEEHEIEDALHAIDQLQLNGGVEPTVTAIRAHSLMIANRGEEAIRLLNERLRGIEGQHRLDLLLLAANLQGQLGRSSEAESLLIQSHREFPWELEPLNQLATLAASRGDWQQLVRWEADLREIEGEAGVLWRAHRVNRLLATPKPSSSSDEISQLCDSIVKNRPNWSRGYYLLAQAALLRGNTAKSIESLSHAVQIGLQDALAVEQLLKLLEAEGRIGEAKQLTNRIGSLAVVSPTIYDRMMSQLFASSYRDQALDSAQRWASNDPKDPLGYIRLGWAIVLHTERSNENTSGAQDLADAERAFRDALKASPNSILAWSSLFTFLIQTERHSEAKELLVRFEREAELDPVEREVTLARLNSLMSHTSAAVTHWLRAARLAEDETDLAKRVAVLSQAANFFTESSPRLAERYCRLAIQNDPSAPVPMLMLVQLLSNRNTPSATTEALELLSQLPVNGSTQVTASKARLQARLLSLRNEDDDLNAAIRLLEDLKSTTRFDRLALAEYYERSGRIGAAFEIWEELTSTDSPSLRELSMFLEFWSRNFQTDGNFRHRVDVALDRLGALPDGQTEQLRWELRLSKLTNSPANVATMIDRFWTKPPVISNLKNETTSTALVASVLRTLCDEGYFSEALQICRNPPPPVSRVLAARLLTNLVMLRSASSDPEVQSEVKQLNLVLDELIESHPVDLMLMQDTGDLASIVGDNERAAEMYNRILAISPEHEVARNNLATIWNASSGRREAALSVINEALATNPDSVALLNTKSEILLQLGRSQEAVQCLKLAAKVDATKATVYLHLALAYEKLGRRTDLETALTTAIALGVEKQPLGPSDREHLTALREHLQL